MQQVRVRAAMLSRELPSRCLRLLCPTAPLVACYWQLAPSGVLKPSASEGHHYHFQFQVDNFMDVRCTLMFVLLMHLLPKSVYPYLAHPRCAVNQCAPTGLQKLPFLDGLSKQLQVQVCLSPSCISYAILLGEHRPLSPGVVTAGSCSVGLA
ncbi:hypothetical protein BD310DRAFT_911822 [Dichomitus squalens]|uniref:Uncharacterized protein n=1 Tax=Dichomitus squalens TaxID=114155 RepID=A0A4Q9QDB9_9APHY|nr:hypothetical protein BD310DRAFT_911822 [Dichomitus squalens]